MNGFSIEIEVMPTDTCLVDAKWELSPEKRREILSEILDKFISDLSSIKTTVSLTFRSEETDKIDKLNKPKILWEYEKILERQIAERKQKDIKMSCARCYAGDRHIRTHCKMCDSEEIKVQCVKCLCG